MDGLSELRTTSWTLTQVGFEGCGTFCKSDPSRAQRLLERLVNRLQRIHNRASSHVWCYMILMAVRFIAFQCITKDKPSHVPEILRFIAFLGHGEVPIRCDSALGSACASRSAGEVRRTRGRGEKEPEEVANQARMGGLGGKSRQKRGRGPKRCGHTCNDEPTHDRISSKQPRPIGKSTMVPELTANPGSSPSEPFWAPCPSTSTLRVELRKLSKSMMIGKALLSGL